MQLLFLIWSFYDAGTSHRSNIVALGDHFVEAVIFMYFAEKISPLRRSFYFGRFVDLR